MGAQEATKYVGGYHFENFMLTRLSDSFFL